MDQPPAHFRVPEEAAFLDKILIGLEKLQIKQGFADEEFSPQEHDISQGGVK